MKKTGIIKAISPKSEGRNAFTLKNEKVDGKDVWFNGFSLEAKKGDEVEFELEIKDDFNNFSKLKVISSGSGTLEESAEPSITKRCACDKEKELIEIESIVMAGSCLQMATELVVAGKEESLKDAVIMVCGALKEAQKQLKEEGKE